VGVVRRIRSLHDVNEGCLSTHRKHALGRNGSRRRSLPAVPRVLRPKIIPGRGIARTLIRICGEISGNAVSPPRTIKVLKGQISVPDIRLYFRPFFVAGTRYVVGQATYIPELDDSARKPLQSLEPLFKSLLLAQRRLPWIRISILNPPL
jgi:hypothetical protein